MLGVVVVGVGIGHLIVKKKDLTPVFRDPGFSVFLRWLNG